MRRSIFIRYALSYTLVLLILFAGISFYLAGTTQRQIQDSIAEAQINRLTRIAVQHESAIAAMISTAEEMGLSPRIEPFSYEKEPWKAYDLQQQLVPYTAMNAFCDQMYLIFAGEDRLYSSAASMTLDRFVRMTEFERTEPDALRELLRTDRMAMLPAQRVKSSLMDGTESSMVGFLLPMGAHSNISKGNLFFLVKETAYRNLFADAIDTEMNTYIFEGETVLASTEDLPLAPEEAALHPEEGRYIRTFSSEGESWLAVTLGERSWGLRYTTVLPMDAVNEAVWRNMRGLLMILLGLLGISVGLIFWMSRRHAKPIERLSSLLDPEDGERKDELTTISSGIRQLTRQNSELTSRLEQSLPMQRRDFVLRFVKGRFADGE